MHQERIRVVVVDDSLMARAFSRRALEPHDDIEVVGTAPNGKRAIQTIEETEPDVIVLDFEMPDMNGIEVLDHLRADDPDLAIMFFSSLGAGQIDASERVLATPLTIWLTKPGKSIGLQGEREVQDSMVESVRALAAERRRLLQPADVGDIPAPLTGTRIELESPCKLLAIGSSTGGPDALAELVSHLPGDLGVPVVIAQHMPVGFTAHLAHRLDTLSALEIREAQGGEELLPGVAYIAPGGQHMVLERTGGAVLTATNLDAPVHACRPAVDPLFESAARSFGSGVLGVILTGMGCDGAAGCGAIKAGGGRIIVQDQATSVVWGMPGAAVRAAAVDLVLPLNAIGGAVGQAVARSHSRTSVEQGT